ncbi:YchJ family metal-binding protein [Aquihabitans daechungensis]|uniref:YchJ family metal-binding protein n=1 Tax=Aquihabitans daechungensis TaxID=1052257 RepID=UPI003BA187B3
MRSRYSAFAVGDLAYLARSWHPDTRPRKIHDDPTRRWTGLAILATSLGGMLDQEGTVEFEAHHTGGRDDARDRPRGPRAQHVHPRRRPVGVRRPPRLTVRPAATPGTGLRRARPRR